MQAKGSIFKHKDLHIDEYTFWEAIYLYNEMGDFLWVNPADPYEKLTENELKPFQWPAKTMANAIPQSPWCPTS